MSDSILSPRPEEVVGVVTWMPARAAIAFQTMAVEYVKRLSAFSAAAEPPYVPPYSSAAGPSDPWAMPEWSEADRPALRWLLGNLNAQQRKLVGCLVAAGINPTTTGRLLHQAGFGDVRASGVFRAIGGRFRQVGRRPIWRHGAATSDGMELSIPDGPARSLFASALRDNWPELAQEVGLA